MVTHRTSNRFPKIKQIAMAAVRKRMSRVRKYADHQFWHMLYPGSVPFNAAMRNSQLHPEIWLHTDDLPDSRQLYNLPWLRFANDCLGLGNMLIVNFGICCSP